jgi:DNA-binding PadR family transcriptional regulator
MSRSLGITTTKILAAIERRVCYGLDIIQHTDLLPGTVYTTLRRLERRKLVEGRWEDADVAAEQRRPRRRYYDLTPDGKEALRAARLRLEDLAAELGGGVAAAGESE